MIPYMFAKYQADRLIDKFCPNQQLLFQNQITPQFQPAVRLSFMYVILVYQLDGSAVL